ncbi:store-operated calcium entry regulator STIMATE isoform X1 [Petromyzon marinus]|uniref:store-operated calcium entry regulator STIMATE isoform X1 n=1 Tax=Petromyzon marinus TaxID=7757 RepID=UPI003F6FB66F
MSHQALFHRCPVGARDAATREADVPTPPPVLVGRYHRHHCRVGDERTAGECVGGERDGRHGARALPNHGPRQQPCRPSPRLRERRPHGPVWRVHTGPAGPGGLQHAHALYDTSKQIFGQLFIHFANVYLSELTEEDPCSLYLINFLLDATLGMVLIWLGIKAASRLVEWRQWESLRFGEYGEPPRCCAWVGQCGVYLLVVACEKTITFLVILIPFWKKVQELILSLIPNPQVELALVMLIVPFVVNAVMFWLTDNFLMKKGKVKAKSDGDDAGSVRYYRRAASRDDSESEVLLSPDESDKVDSDRDTRRLIGNGTAAKKKKVRFEMPV